MHTLDRSSFPASPSPCRGETIPCDRASNSLAGWLLLAGAAKALAARDQWIGWDRQCRPQNWPWGINPTRRLIVSVAAVPVAQRSRSGAEPASRRNGPGGNSFRVPPGRSSSTTDGHGFTEFLAADMIHPEGEPRKECWHPPLSGLIRGSILETGNGARPEMGPASNRNSQSSSAVQPDDGEAVESRSLASPQGYAAFVEELPGANP